MKMGQARKRGSFEERRDAAIEKRKKLLDLFPKQLDQVPAQSVTLTDLAIAEKLAKPRSMYVKGDEDVYK
jgi:hypothetical protein